MKPAGILKPSLLPSSLAGHVESDGLARTCLYRRLLTGMLFRSR